MCRSVSDEFLDKIFTNNNGDRFIVIQYDGKDAVWIQYLNSGYVQKATTRTIRSGKVKDPFSPRYYGKGFMGVGKYSMKDRKAYLAWTNMLGRVYSDKFEMYADCKICEEWHDYQNFAEWFNRQPNSKEPGYELNKDTVNARGKLYSPETCELISKQRNNALIREQKTNKSGTTGVQIVHLKRKGIVYRVHISIDAVPTYLGTFSTIAEAKEVYENAKLSYIKRKD